MAESRGPARLLGVVALVVGVIGAAALWLLSGKRYDDAVAELAPAPIGCDTTLVFDRTGTYTLFVETKGSVGEIDGDCDADDRSYDLGDEEPPEVGLTLVDEDGRAVELDRADGPSYDRAGASGTGVSRVEIEDAGDYVLTAEADDPSAMVRVGRDPASGVTAMRVGAMAVLIAGIVLGVVAFALGRRRRTPAAPVVAGPSPAWPYPGYRAPPTAPPYANPPVPPPYVVPARPPGQPPLGGPGSGQPLPPPPPPR